MIINSLEQIVSQNQGLNHYFYLRNLLKEGIQLYILDFVYTSKWGKNLLFKGGSCLRILFELPRLSEDLDFDYIHKQDFKLNNFLTDLNNYFSKKLQYKNLSIKISKKQNIVYLKFPVLDKLGLAAKKEQTRILFLRLDICPAFGQKYRSQYLPKSTPNFSYVIQCYSLPDLFAGKIAAILSRNVKENNKIIPRIKGRDYFDLLWFLEKKSKLNFAYLSELIKIKNKAYLKTRLIEKIENLDLEVFKADIITLFKEKAFIESYIKNYKQMARSLLENI